MLISNFDLCKFEWLELVFAKRNKEYGAYYIRQHHDAYMAKAMSITFLSITVAFLAGSAIIGKKPMLPPLTQTVVDLTNYKPVTPPKTDKPKTPAATAPQQRMQQDPIPVVVPDAIAAPTPPPLVADVPIGPVTIDGPNTNAANIDAGPVATPSEGTETKEDESIYTKGIDVMPEPFGGAAAWGKFLQKNLRYPSEASEKGLGGRVMVSFIVEKDGHLSNILVDKGAGYGMDEEAARVLKLSKAWKPGLANGHPVRVKYMLPINFVLNE